MKKTIYNLDVISNFSIYSKFNVNYDRILGDRSLKGFVKINKKSKTLKKLNFLEEIDKKFPKQTNIKKDIEPYDYINKHILKIEEHNNDLNKNNKILKTEPNNYKGNYFNSKKKKNKQIINLDPFKYNPNYNAIYKKIPYVRIIETRDNRQKSNSSKKSNINKSSSKSIVLNKSKINNTKETKEEEEEDNNSNNNDKDNDNDNEHNESKNNSKNDKIKLPLVKINRNCFGYDNHALRFSKYGNQRSYKSRNEDKIFPIYYNSRSVNYNKKKINAINFDKMMSRKENDFVNIESLKTPSFN